MKKQMALSVTLLLSLPLFGTQDDKDTPENSSSSCHECPSHPLQIHEKQDPVSEACTPTPTSLSSRARVAALNKASSSSSSSAPYNIDPSYQFPKQPVLSESDLSTDWSYCIIL